MLKSILIFWTLAQVGPVLKQRKFKCIVWCGPKVFNVSSSVTYFLDKPVCRLGTYYYIYLPTHTYIFLKDKDVPYESSILLMERLTTSDVDVILKKTGDHRLNTRVDHGLIISELDRLLKQFPVKSEEENATVMKSKL